MITVKERKEDIQKTINKNPTSIILKYKIKTIKDGAWKIEEREEHLKVRLFEQKSPETVLISDTKGTAQTTKKYGMLADSKSNLKDLSNESIVFDTDYGKMEIVGIYPQITLGDICGYQCDLKRIS